MPRPRIKRPDTFAGRLAERVEALRKLRHLDSADLAKKAGISRSAIVRLESGRSDSPISTVVAVALGLGVSVGNLVDAVVR